MKKFLCILLSAVMLLGMVNVASADEAGEIPQKVEISFKVGDSTLMINGNPVTVETPYVAGAGTTLVPLRVITEAFGAKVTWVNETKEIILEYPDVNITLQIGNVNVTVNEHTEQLPEAPVLSPNGVTMVPLRFVSETFGAVVSYDNETAAITVVKESGGDSSTISSSTDLPRIGDSYWNWSMMTPQGMMMTERYLDGCYTVFSDEDEATLSVYIDDVSDDEDNSYEVSYTDMKTYLSSRYTLSRAEKGTDALGNSTYRITGRSKEGYVDFYAVYRGDRCFEVCYLCDADSSMRTTVETIISSFKVEFAATEEEVKTTHDLSNVGEDGYRMIEDDELKLSFKVPATCVDAGLGDLNVIGFVSGEKGDLTRIYVGVYSKNETTSAKSLAEDDYSFHKKYYNKEFCDLSNFHQYTAAVPGENAYYYWLSTKGLLAGDYEMYDVFFENGDYIYNVTVRYSSGNKEVYNTVMESLKIETLDSEQVGVFLRTGREYTPYTASTNDWSLKLDSSWKAVVEATNTKALYSNLYVDAYFMLSVADAGDIKPSETKEVAEQLIASMKGNGRITERLNRVEIGTKQYYTFQILEEDADEGMAVYTTVYLIITGGDMYLFALYENQDVAGAGARADFEQILATFDVK